MSIKGIAPLSVTAARQRAEEANLSARTDGATDPGEAFEAIMLRKMVKSLRSTVQESGLWQGVTGGQMYDHFIEEALSDYLAKSGGIGIARLFEEQEGSQLDPVIALDAITAEMETSDTSVEAVDPLPEADNGSRPLAELLPPQYDSWLNSPAAEQTLRASLEPGKLRTR